MVFRVLRTCTAHTLCTCLFQRSCDCVIYMRVLTQLTVYAADLLLTSDSLCLQQPVGQLFCNNPFVVTGLLGRCGS